MLFNSYPFIFVFLPVVLFVYFAAARVGLMVATSWLAAAALFFYGWWSPVYLWLLIASIVWNFGMGRLVMRWRDPAHGVLGKVAIWTAVGGNLALLGYYKYAGFFASNLNAAFGLDLHVTNVILPLGISFYTFTQISFLIDTYRGENTRYSFIRYLLFICYFPHLLAGPILHHRDVMPQFADPKVFRPDRQMLLTGGVIFLMGLFKKVVLADGIAPYVAPGFHAANIGATSFFDSWAAALAFTLQIYFDFSGYSDMAVGVSRMLGVRIPINFNSPYQSRNITELWQRWHMSLTRFLGDYLFGPLGGLKRSAKRRAFALIATMLLAGFWHGADWTFIAFGGLHGVYLLIHHNYRTMQRKAGRKRGDVSRLMSVRNWALTYIAWSFSAAVFRTDSLGAWWRMTRGMLGLEGFALPNAWYDKLGAAGVWLERIGFTFGQVAAPESIKGFVWIVPLLAIAVFLPNTQRLMMAYMKEYRPADFAAPPFFRRLAFVPNRTWAIVLGLGAGLALLKMNRISEFLYYQF